MPSTIVVGADCRQQKLSGATFSGRRRPTFCFPTKKIAEASLLLLLHTYGRLFPGRKITAMSTTTAPPRQINTDVRRRTVLPTTLQNLAHLSASSANELPSNEYLDKIEEELNRKVDADMDMLVDGMAELVKLSQVCLRCNFFSSPQ